ncbi:MAG TPA: hypothetical protein VFG73_01335 [Rhodanobacteraceae bacterium]|nr:hypothetical protein [Rhodanobacteraceae bacterium]
MNKTADQAFERQARALFARSCADLDPRTAIRLRNARAQALAGPVPRRATRFALLPAGALAVCALALAVVWYQPGMHGGSAQPAHVTPANASTPATDTPPDDADVALYSDLDFYRWLASQPAVAQGNMRH